MRFLTRDECQAWIREHHPNSGGSTHLLSQGSSSYLRVDVSSTARSTYYLSKVFVRWLGPFQSCLFWVTEFGIWPSSECPELFRRYRSTFSEARTIGEIPGHLALSDELEPFEVFIALAMQFGWGGFVVTDCGHRFLFLDHDGVATFRGHADWAAELDEARTLDLPAEVCHSD